MGILNIHSRVSYVKGSQLAKDNHWQILSELQRHSTLAAKAVSFANKRQKRLSLDEFD